MQQTFNHSRIQDTPLIRLFSVDNAMSTLPTMLPDYMLVFAVAVLTHDPQFTDINDLAQLKTIERCLWLVLEPLVINKDFFCFGFYKNIVDRMKNHKDAVRPDDDEVNHVSVRPLCLCVCDQLVFITVFDIIYRTQKMWAICDIALHLIYTKTTNYDTRDLPMDARIPSMYFKPQEDDFTNTDYYLPVELYAAATIVPGSTKRLHIVERKQTTTPKEVTCSNKIVFTNTIIILPFPLPIFDSIQEHFTPSGLMIMCNASIPINNGNFFTPQSTSTTSTTTTMTLDTGAKQSMDDDDDDVANDADDNNGNTEEPDEINDDDEDLDTIGVPAAKRARN